MERGALTLHKRVVLKVDFEECALTNSLRRDKLLIACLRRGHCNRDLWRIVDFSVYRASLQSSPVNSNRNTKTLSICGSSHSGSSPSYQHACGLVSDSMPSTFTRCDHNLIRCISLAHHHALRLGQGRKTSLPQHGTGPDHCVRSLNITCKTLVVS